MSGDALNALKEDSTKLGIVIFYILLFGKNFAIQYFFSSHVLRESCSGSAKSPRIVKENIDRKFVAILQFFNSYFVVMLQPQTCFTIESTFMFYSFDSINENYSLTIHLTAWLKSSILLSISLWLLISTKSCLELRILYRFMPSSNILHANLKAKIVFLFSHANVSSQFLYEEKNFKSVLDISVDMCNGLGTLIEILK